MESRQHLLNYKTIELVNMVIELEEKVKRYKEALEAVQQYTEERKMVSLYLESISDFTRTSLFDIENNITKEQSDS